jgi:hypothetical protein
MQMRKRLAQALTMVALAVLVVAPPAFATGELSATALGEYPPPPFVRPRNQKVAGSPHAQHALCAATVQQPE